MIKVFFGLRSYSNCHNFWDSYYESCCHGNKNNVIISYLNFSGISQKKRTNSNLRPYLLVSVTHGSFINLLSDLMQNLITFLAFHFYFSFKM